LVEVEELVEGGFVTYRYEIRKPQPIEPNRAARHRRQEEMGVSIKLTQESGGFRGLEPGIYNARCDLIADLGMQDTGKYGLKHKVYIRFAVPDQTGEDKDGNKFQMSIGSKFTASLGKKANLRKVLEGWRGKPFTEEELEGFELTKLLNAPATIVVGTYLDREGKERPSLENVLKCKSEVDGLLRKPVAYGPESTQAELAEAPEWLRDAIIAGKGDAPDADDEEEQTQHAARQASEDDDIPF
jgi:hypothetical protein